MSADILHFVPRMKPATNDAQRRVHEKLLAIQIELWPHVHAMAEKHEMLYTIMALMDLAIGGVEHLAVSGKLHNNEIALLRNRVMRDFNAVMGEGK